MAFLNIIVIIIIIISVIIIVLKFVCIWGKGGGITCHNILTLLHSNCMKINDLEIN